MKTLSTLLGGSIRAKIIRLFLLNPGRLFDKKEVARITKISSDRVGKELSALLRIGVIRKKHSKKREVGTKWCVDEHFPYLDTLTAFVTDSAVLEEYDVLYEIRYAGSPKLVVLSGVFASGWDSGLDILIVSDRMHKGDLAYAIRKMEGDLGTEIRYALLSVEDYHYRKSVHDRLVRDVFDYPHRILVDRISEV